ncbi:PadR family transcriptional regulator [Streptomyces pathocidini]|uniref:PadR family transcriptional regulator n=1 Tax=Streptomyces pathocidini TaxID=1650571 RepID=UPI0033D9DFE3
MAKRRKVGNVMALPVLALLVERPMHPYEMGTALRMRHKEDSIKINYSSLYTVVGNLEKHGFVEVVSTHREGRRPERTVYRITDSGREELEDWIRDLISRPEKEFPRFEAALSLLPVLPPDEVIELLRGRLRTLDQQVAGRAGALEQGSKDIPRLFHVESEYALVLLRAEADWIRSLLTELEAGTLTGVAAWRSLHATGRMPEEWLALQHRQNTQQPEAGTDE